MSKLKLTKKHRLTAVKLLKNVTKIVKGITVRPFSDLKQHQVTHTMLQNYGITKEMIEGYNEL